MKKSFLKRVTAAVIALPVALSQTVLFASFAAGESNNNAVDAISLDSFLTVPANQALYTPQDGEVYRALEAQQAKDGDAGYRYFIQESVWNTKVFNALNSYADTDFSIDASSVLENVNTDRWFMEMLKDAADYTLPNTTDKANTMAAHVGNGYVDFVADVNYPYEEFAKKIVERSISQSYKDVDFKLESSGTVDATITVEADTSKIVPNKNGKDARTIPYSVEIVWDGKKLTTVEQVYEKATEVVSQIREDTKVSVANTFDKYTQQKNKAQQDLDDAQKRLDAAQKELDNAKESGASASMIAEKQAELDARQTEKDEKQAELDAAALRLEHAHKMVDTKIDEVFDAYMNRINNAKKRYDRALAKDIDRTVTAEDVDAAIAKADEIVERRTSSKRINNAKPTSLNDFKSHGYYGTINKVFDNVLGQINSQTAEKSTSGTTYSVNMTMDEIIDKAAELRNVTAYGKHIAGQEIAEGYAYAYFANDDDADLDTIKGLINDELAKEGEGYVLDETEGSLYTIKAVEVDGKGAIDAPDSYGTLDIYRIIAYKVVKPEETTTPSTTEATTTSTEPVVTTAPIETTGTGATTAPIETTGTGATTAPIETTGTGATTAPIETTGTGATTAPIETTGTGATTAPIETTGTGATTAPIETTGTGATTAPIETTGTGATTAPIETTGTGATTAPIETTGTGATTEPIETGATTEPIETGVTTEPVETGATTEPVETDVTTEPVETDVTEPVTEPNSEVVPTETIEIDADSIVIDEVAQNVNFYFSHDPNAFTAGYDDDESLINVTNTKAKDVNGNVATPDPAKFTFGTVEKGEIVGLSPKDIYDDRKEAYNKVQLTVYYDGKRVNGSVDVYIGVKGDANLDGKANAVDSSKVLQYAANFGAGRKPHIFTTEDDTLDSFVYFLADVTDESKDRGLHSSIPSVGAAGSKLDAIDSSYILIYAAGSGASSKFQWIPDTLRTAPYPKYSERIAQKAGLLPTDNQ